MKFTQVHGTGNQYWLRVNNNAAPFAKLCENVAGSREKDPELVAACRLVKAAPKLLEAAEHILAILQHPTRGVNIFDQELLEQAVAEARGEV